MIRNLVGLVCFSSVLLYGREKAEPNEAKDLAIQVADLQEQVKQLKGSAAMVSVDTILRTVPSKLKKLEVQVDLMDQRMRELPGHHEFAELMEQQQTLKYLIEQNEKDQHLERVKAMLEAEIDPLGKQVRYLYEQFTAYRKTSEDDLRGLQQAIQKEMLALGSDMQSLLSQLGHISIDNPQETLRALRKEIAEQSAQVSKLANDHQRLDQTKVGSEEIQALKIEIAEAQNVLKGFGRLRGRQRRLCERFMALEKNSRSQMQVLESQVKDIDSRISDVAQFKAGAEAQSLAQQSKVETLEKQMAALSQQARTLGETLADLQQSSSAIQAMQQRLEQHEEQLAQVVAAPDTTHHLEIREDSVAKLKRQMIAISKHCLSLQKQVASMEGVVAKVDTLAQELASSRLEIAALRAQLADERVDGDLAWIEEQSPNPPPPGTPEDTTPDDSSDDDVTPQQGAAPAGQVPGDQTLPAGQIPGESTGQPGQVSTDVATPAGEVPGEGDESGAQAPDSGPPQPVQAPPFQAPPGPQAPPSQIPAELQAPQFQAPQGPQAPEFQAPPGPQAPPMNVPEAPQAPPTEAPEFVAPPGPQAPPMQTPPEVQVTS